MAPWQIERVAVYQSGRTEAVYSDGSAAILHPGSSSDEVTSVSFFAPNGVRQRLLSACLPRQSCGKIVAAATLRDRFHPIPSLLSSPAKERRRWAQPCRHVAWPEARDATLAQQDGSILIESLDTKAKLLLAPHGRSYVVDWWQALLPSDLRSEWESLIQDDPSVNQYRIDSSTCQMQAFNRPSYEHVHQVQCFSVLDAVELAWLYPLFVALMQRELAGDEVLMSRISSLKSELLQRLADGQLLDSGCGVTGPLPDVQKLTWSTGRACDDVSPAVAMGEASEGSIRVFWTPSATIWLHGDQEEATIDVTSNSAGEPSWLLESSLKGQFWKSTGGSNKVPEVLHRDFLGAAAPSLGALIEEAVKLLHHNKVAHLTGGECCRRELETDSRWVPEAEITEGKVHLTIFTSSAGVGLRHLRLRFPDGARLSATVALPPRRSDTFKLITASGEVLHRSFSEPLGAEWQVQTLQALLRRFCESSQCSAAVLHRSFSEPLGAEWQVQTLQALLRRFEFCERERSFTSSAAEALASAALRRSLLACRS